MLISHFQSEQMFFISPAFRAELAAARELNLRLVERLSRYERVDQEQEEEEEEASHSESPCCHE